MASLLPSASCTDQLPLSPTHCSLAPASSLDLWFIGLSVIFTIICLIRINTHLLIKLPKYQVVSSCPVWFLRPLVDLTLCMLARCWWKNSCGENSVGDCVRSLTSPVRFSDWRFTVRRGAYRAAGTETYHLSSAKVDLSWLLWEICEILFWRNLCFLINSESGVASVMPEMFVSAIGRTQLCELLK